MSDIVWKFILANTNSFENYGFLQNASSKQLQVVLNRPGQLTFSLALDNEMAQYIEPISTCIKAYRGNDLVWSGPVWTMEENLSDNRVSVTAVGWFELLNHRYTKRRLTYNNQDISLIAQDLFYQTFLTESETSLEVEEGPATGGNNASIGTNAWSSTSNITANDAAYATATVTSSAESQYLTATDFGFAIPAGSVITGIKAEFDKTSTSNNTVKDNSVKLIKGGVVSGEEKAGSVYWKSSLKIGKDTYGSENDLWELELEPSDVNASDFGVAVSARYSSSPGSDTAKVDYISLTVYYIADSFTPDYDIPVRGGSTENSFSMNRTYERFSNVGQEIIALSDIENGFDFEVDPETRELNIYTKLQNILPDIIYGFGKEPNNVLSLTISKDGSFVSNRIYVTGKYAVVQVDDEVSQTNYGRLEAVDSLNDIVNDQILAAYGNAEIAVRNNPKIVYNISPQKFTTGKFIPQPFVDFNLGDIIYLSAKRNHIDLNKQFIRIFGINISIDENGIEQISNLQTLAN